MRINYPAVHNFEYNQIQHTQTKKTLHNNRTKRLLLKAWSYLSIGQICRNFFWVIFYTSYTIQLSLHTNYYHFQYNSQVIYWPYAYLISFCYEEEISLDVLSWNKHVWCIFNPLVIMKGRNLLIHTHLHILILFVISYLCEIWLFSFEVIST